MAITRTLALMLAAVLAPLAPAQEPRKPAPKKPADAKVWMALRGPLLWEEAFAGGVWSKEWNLYKGKFVVEKEQLKVAEQASDGHLATMTRNFKESNVIIQFGFKFEGAKWLGIQLDDAVNDAKKEHVAQLTIQPDSFRIEKMTGFAGTTKNTTVDQKKMKFESGAWHRIVWEIQGDEMLAAVDDKAIVMAKVDGMTLVRSRLQLVTSGEQAWFDDIKVWKAEADPRWAKRKAELQESIKK